MLSSLFPRFRKPRIPQVPSLAVLFFLVVLAMFPASSSAFDPSEYPYNLEASLDVWPYYVGNEEVDLAVRVDGSHLGCSNVVSLYRDSAVIVTKSFTFSFIGETKYFVANDSGLTKGDVHEYRVVQTITCSDDPLVFEGDPVSATVGEVGGIVTDAKKWSGGTWDVAYVYDGSIVVEQGATLTIDPFTRVILSTGTYPHIWRIMGGFSADRVSFVNDFQIRAQDEYDTERDYSNSSFSMTDCIVQGSLLVQARNSPIFVNNVVSGEMYLYYRQLNPVAISLTDIDNPLARLVIEDPSELTIQDNTLKSIMVRGTAPLDGGNIVISDNQLISESIEFGDESRLTVKNIGTSSLKVEKNIFAEPYPGPIVLSHFTNSAASQRLVSGNQGMREILLGDDADEDGGVHYTTIEKNVVQDNLYNDGICIRLDRGTNNTIGENQVYHPEGLSKGFPGAGIGLGFDTGLDREAVSDNIVEKNLVTGFDNGVLLDWGTRNAIRENRLTGNRFGMWLNSAKENTITRNVFHGNYANMGLGQLRSSGEKPEANLVHDNLFGVVEGNTNAFFVGFTYKPNEWNTEKSAGPNVVGGPFLGGNFWADYTGMDQDGDGLGDTPYAIVPDNADQLPLVMQIVNSTGDAGDSDTSDGMCNTGGLIDRDGTSEPECTLRAAIEQVNAGDGWNRIVFDIPTEELPVIRPQSGLPSLSENFILDGGSQPGAGKVKIDGSQAGAASGLKVTDGTDIFIIGLIMENFSSHGIYFDPLGESQVSLIDLEIRGNGGYGVFQRNDLGVYPFYLRNCSIQGNQLGGLYLWTGVMGSEYLSITENGGDGIYTAGKGFSGGVRVGYSTIADNLGHGVRQLNPGGDIIVGGTADSPMLISGNGKDGINSNGRVTASFVDIRGNGGKGIRSGGVDGVIIHDSSVRSNGSDGIVAEEGILSAKRSSVSGNGGHGIYAMGQGNRNYAAMMENMTLADNNGHGLYSEDGDVHLANCRFHDNIRSGVRVESGNVMAQDILSSQNGENGLDLDGDASVEGGEACRNQGQDVSISGVANIASFAHGAACQSTDFSASSNSGDVPLTVDFSEATGMRARPVPTEQIREQAGGAEIFSAHWNFGDGDTSILPAPTHTYDEPGTYDVVLFQVLTDGTWQSSIRKGFVEATAGCLENANCNDGVYCNGEETCEQGVCQAGTPPCFEDGLFCNGIVWCDEEANSCRTTTAPCADFGLSCDEQGDNCLCDSSLQGVSAILQISVGLPPSDPRLSVVDATGNGVVGLEEAARFMRDAAAGMQ